MRGSCLWRVATGIAMEGPFSGGLPSVAGRRVMATLPASLFSERFGRWNGPARGRIRASEGIESLSGTARGRIWLRGADSLTKCASCSPAEGFLGLGYSFGMGGVASGPVNCGLPSSPGSWISGLRLCGAFSAWGSSSFGISCSPGSLSHANSLTVMGLTSSLSKEGILIRRRTNPRCKATDMASHAKGLLPGRGT